MLHILEIWSNKHYINDTSVLWKSRNIKREMYQKDQYAQIWIRVKLYLCQYFDKRICANNSQLNMKQRKKKRKPNIRTGIRKEGFKV